MPSPISGNMAYQIGNHPDIQKIFEQVLKQGRHTFFNLAPTVGRKFLAAALVASNKILSTELGWMLGTAFVASMLPPVGAEDRLIEEFYKIGEEARNVQGNLPVCNDNEIAAYTGTETRFCHPPNNPSLVVAYTNLGETRIVNIAVRPTTDRPPIQVNLPPAQRADL